MEPATKTRYPDVKLKPFPLPNGAVKKAHQPPPPPAEEFLYRECLKNHAASLGGHALDGCGEFMPSPASNPADPTSLKCAACGCHRNFHRRVAGHHRTSAAAASADDGLEGEGEGERDVRDDGGEEDADVDDAFEAAARHRSSSSPPLPPYFSSAPHMLLALSSGVRSQPPAAGPGRSLTSPVPVASVPPPRKRFRTKFSPEQKERMLELSERLGWRLQKRDEGLVEEYCKGIGVGKGVFKVWMHNNKHHLFGPSASRRGEGRSAMAVAVAGGAGGRTAEVDGGSIDSGNADGNVNGHAMNGSSSSS